MEIIKIAHLFYDLMNLNGESGNLIALKKHFEIQNVRVEIHFLSIDDEIQFNKYDIYYIGNGSFENRQLVLDNLMKYNKQIKEAVSNNKYFFITGNSTSLFGKYIINFDKSKTPTLNIFDYYTEVFANDFEHKIVGEYEYSSKIIKERIIGFQNRFEKICNNCHPFLNNEIDLEGYNENNFFATYLLGPFFVRNPYLTDYFVKKILKEKKLPFKLKKNTLEYQAYYEYLKSLAKE